MSKILTERKAIYRIVALAVIFSAWSYVLSEIYKYEMDAHYSMTPRRVEEVESRHFLDKTTHIEVPEEEEVATPGAVAYGTM